MDTAMHTAPVTRAEAILGVPMQPGQHAHIVEVAPAKAAMLLAGMPPQRPLRRDAVAAYAAQIRSGAWEVTSQGIAFDTDGRLVDGQHRLTACAETDTPIQVLAMFNLPNSAVLKIDRGKVRIIADDLVMLGVAPNNGQAQLLQAAGRPIWHFDAGRQPWNQNASEGGTLRNFSTIDTMQVMQVHPLLFETCNWVMGHRRRGIQPAAGPFAAFLTLFREVNDTKAIRFAEEVVYGEALACGDPAYMLRDSMQRIDRQRRGYISRASFMIRLVYAWNAYYEDRKLSKLYSASTDGNLPKIAGYRARPA